MLVRGRRQKLQYVLPVHSLLRQSPLRDRPEDHLLFVAPTGYEQALRAAAEGLNLLLLGARGSGRTSTLRQLQLALRREASDGREDGQDAGNRCTPVFVDLAAAKSPGDALELIAVTCSEALGMPLDWPMQPRRHGEGEDMRRIRDSLGRLEEIPSCVLIVDNADARLAHELLGTYKDRLWDTPHQWILAAGRSEEALLLGPPAGSFWERELRLDYTTSDAEELLQRRLEGDAKGRQLEGEAQGRPAGKAQGDLHEGEAQGRRRPSERLGWLGPLVASVGTNPLHLIRAASAASDEERREDVLDALEQWHRQVSMRERRERELVFELLSGPPVSASDRELLSRLGWARSALLHTLNWLELAGLVKSWTERGTGRGRPRRLFTAVEPGRYEMPEHQRAELRRRREAEQRRLGARRGPARAGGARSALPGEQLKRARPARGDEADPLRDLSEQPDDQQRGDEQDGDLPAPSLLAAEGEGVVDRVGRDAGVERA